MLSASAASGRNDSMNQMYPQGSHLLARSLQFNQQLVQGLKSPGLRIEKQPSAHKLHQMLMSSIDGSSMMDDEMDSRKSSIDISDINRYLKIKNRRSKNTSSFLESNKGLKTQKESKKDKNVRSFLE